MFVVLHRLLAFITGVDLCLVVFYIAWLECRYWFLILVWIVFAFLCVLVFWICFLCLVVYWMLADNKCFTFGCLCWFAILFVCFACLRGWCLLLCFVVVCGGSFGCFASLS